MKSIRETLTSRTNQGGQIVLGDPLGGCLYCGTVAMKYSGDGKAVLYHPAVICCLTRVQQQHDWRVADRQRLVARMRDHDRRITELWDAVELAGSQTAAENARKVASKAEATRPLFQAGIDKQLAKLDGEIREIKVRLEQLQGP